MTFPTPAQLISEVINVVRKQQLRCCIMECGRPAEFEIYGESNHPEDYTESCEEHVGALLGTPDWLTEDNRNNE